VVIKPSGVNYASRRGDLVVTDLDEKWWKDRCCRRAIDTHTLLLREFPDWRHRPHALGVCHLLGAGWPRDSLLGTTMRTISWAVPVTEELSAQDVAGGYVRNTGAVIVRRFREQGLDPIAVPGVLVKGHAPFAWGRKCVGSSGTCRRAGVRCAAGIQKRPFGSPETGIPLHVSEYHYQRNIVQGDLRQGNSERDCLTERKHSGRRNHALPFVS